MVTDVGYRGVDSPRDDRASRWCDGWSETALTVVPFGGFDRVPEHDGGGEEDRAGDHRADDDRHDGTVEAQREPDHEDSDGDAEQEVPTRFAIRVDFATCWRRARTGSISLTDPIVARDYGAPP